MAQFELTRENAIKAFAKRSVITTPGRYRLSVINANYSTEVGGTANIANLKQNQVGIVNFSAMTPYHMKAAKAALDAGELQQALNSCMSATVFMESSHPEKGDICDVDVDYITTKDGEQALVAKSWKIVPAIVASKVSASYFDEITAPVVKTAKKAAEEPAF